MNITEKIRQETVLFDGGMGTLLQASGMPAGELPEQWGMTHPHIIIGVHEQYLNMGSDVISANTFGANILKFPGKAHGTPDLITVVQTAVMCAQTAVRKVGGKKRYIALDIGPTGKLLKPLGDLEFEEAVRIFAETVKAGVATGVDLILIETMNDSLETKAAVLAAKENSDLPVFVTNTYDASGKLMTGANADAMVAMLEGLGVDALGVNCGLGPDKLENTVKRLTQIASVPVIVTPNAGLPSFDGEKTVYDTTPEQFAVSMQKFLSYGVHGFGGCCGTTPEHIGYLSMALDGMPVLPLSDKNRSVISSYTHAVEFGNRSVIIGERINPTGKKLLKEALREKNMSYILNEGIEQEAAGAHVLDVNCGLPDIDEAEMLKTVTRELQAVTNLPLQIDTANPVALEQALRIYNGKPMINSVCGKAESMETVFPLAAKYGGLIVALTLDENGIPETAQERFAIYENIVKYAREYGISRKDIIADPLAMTVSADGAAAKVTLDTVRMIKEAGGLTTLGVSNVSFGLPERERVNTAFYTMALANGLDAAILNPKSDAMMSAYYASMALLQKDPMCARFIAYAADNKAETSPKTQNESVPVTKRLQDAIVKGMKEQAASCAKDALGQMDALAVISTCIVPALDEVGKGFEAKTTFLPQLLMSAESAKAAFDVLKQNMPKDAGKKKLHVVIATVKGDIHDIGKNIVKVLLENYGFAVTDLGKDVAPETVVKAVKETKAALVGLSALMTTTVPAMEETVKLLKQECPDAKTVVGGAVLTQSYADMICADFYAKDAMEAVRYAEKIDAAC